MSRDIRITPHLGSTATGLYPEIKFRGISQSFITLKVDDDGSVVYTGTYGALFNITDNKDGLLHSVNDISGLPILSVYSYDYVQMGKWDKNTLVVNVDKVGIGLTGPSSSLHIYSTQSGAFRLEDGTQGVGKYLVSDTNGVGTWTSSVAGGYTQVSINIGDWDMSASPYSISVTHSLSSTEWKTVRNVSAIIRNDADSVYTPVTMGNIILLTNYGVALYWYDQSNFYLANDSNLWGIPTSYDTATSFNRGWIYYEYIPD